MPGRPRRGTGHRLRGGRLSRAPQPSAPSAGLPPESLSFRECRRVLGVCSSLPPGRPLVHRGTGGEIPLRGRGEIPMLARRFSGGLAAAVAAAGMLAAGTGIGLAVVAGRVRAHGPAHRGPRLPVRAADPGPRHVRHPGHLGHVPHPPRRLTTWLAQPPLAGPAITGGPGEMPRETRGFLAGPLVPWRRSPPWRSPPADPAPACPVMPLSLAHVSLLSGRAHLAAGPLVACCRRRRRCARRVLDMACTCSRHRVHGRGVY